MHSITRAALACARGLNRATIVVIGVLMLVLTSIVILQVVYRYLLELPLVWSDEAARHLLVQRDDLIEETGDFRVDAIGVLGQANAEVPTPQRTESADELAAIDKVPLGLNVHSTLRSVILPPPRLHTHSPPAMRTPL